MSLADLNINKTLGRKWCQEQLFPSLKTNFQAKIGFIDKPIFSNCSIKNMGEFACDSHSNSTKHPKQRLLMSNEGGLSGL